MLLKILDKYVSHIEGSDNNSLLARIYGLFTIKSNHFSDLDFIVMQNTVQVLDKSNERLTFDMKGSSTNRYVRAYQSDINHKVLKDNNFLELSQNR